MNSPNFSYEYSGKTYNVYVTKRFQRNIYFRLRDDGFYVSCPKMTSKEAIIKGLNKFAGKLIKNFDNRNSNYSFEDDFIYLLGEKYVLSSMNIFNENELNIFLKKNSLKVITELVRINEKIMGITDPYKVSTRNTKSQFGSNTKNSHRLSFQISLIHYSREIIESVVIHELAHDFYRNHQKEFYNVVYKYCPNYDTLQKKLKNGIKK